MLPKGRPTREPVANSARVENLFLAIAVGPEDVGESSDSNRKHEGDAPERRPDKFR